jgi:hypothetical protein
MVGKILFTAAVIAAVILMVRLRGRRTSAPVAVGSPAGPPRVLIRWLATGVVAVMVAAAALFVYLDWRAAREIVQVRVVDARSGNVSTYQAYRGEIEERSFRALDGRRITLAETERMETAASEAR